MFDNLLLRPSLHCKSPLHFTTLHPTTLHYTSPHFTQIHSATLHHTSPHFTQLQFATLYHNSPNYTSLHFTTLHPNTLRYTSPLPENTQHSLQTNIHAPSRIRTHDLSRQPAADLRLRPRGYWNRQFLHYRLKKYAATRPN